MAGRRRLTAPPARPTPVDSKRLLGYDPGMEEQAKWTSCCRRRAWHRWYGLTPYWWPIADGIDDRGAYWHDKSGHFRRPPSKEEAAAIALRLLQPGSNFWNTVEREFGRLEPKEMAALMDVAWGATAPSLPPIIRRGGTPCTLSMPSPIHSTPPRPSSTGRGTSSGARRRSFTTSTGRHPRWRPPDQKSQPGSNVSGRCSCITSVSKKMAAAAAQPLSPIFLPDCGNRVGHCFSMCERYVPSVKSHQDADNSRSPRPPAPAKGDVA